ncbi:MFS transporter [Serratia marcescens]|uniref:MFS transporter n=1 Tax=Serratia marcescens TaxID=615 RepID=UPI002FD8BFF8
MRAFFLLCVSRTGLCLGTMMFAGALPTIRSEWQLGAASAGTVQTVFSLTNALALLVASWWCDSLGARRVYLLFSWLGAGAQMLFAVFAHSYIGALVLMAFVGLTQGGAYTPALLLAMGMNGPARRGYAIGMILAASSLGYFLSVFIAGWSAMRWGAGVAFALVGYQEPQPRTLGRKTKRESYAITYATLLLLIGYIAHSWELLGNWAWAPSLVSEALSGFSLDPLSAGLIAAAVIHLAGMIATLIVGTVSDYFNRASVLTFVGAAGALGSLLMGWSANWGPGWTLLFVSIGSFFILGDSGVLSAAMADNVPPQQLGSVMGWRSLLGFGIGSFAPLSFGIVMDTTQSWGTSYAVLACGGGVACLAAGLLWRQHLK